MFTLLYKFFGGLLFDEGVARRLLRGGALGVATVASTFAAVLQTLPQDQATALWSEPKKLVFMAMPGLLAGFGGMIAHGDKTPAVLKTFAATLDKPEVRNN